MVKNTTNIINQNNIKKKLTNYKLLKYELIRKDNKH